MLVRNSQRDGRKGGKFQNHWLGPYKIVEFLGKGIYKLANPKNDRQLKKCVNICRLKVFYSSTHQKINFSNSSIFQTQTCSENEDNDSIQPLPSPISPILDDSIPSLPPPISPILDDSIPSLPPPISPILDDSIPSLPPPISPILDDSIPSLPPPISPILDGSIPSLPPPISPILDDSIPSLPSPISPILEDSIPSLPPPISPPLSISKIVTSTPEIHRGYFVPLHTGGISPVSKALFQSTSSQSRVPTLKAVTLTERKRTQSVAQLKDQQKQKRIRTAMYNASNKSQGMFCMYIQYSCVL